MRPRTVGHAVHAIEAFARVGVAGPTRPTIEVAHGLTRAVFPSKLHETRALLAGDPSREELAWASRKLRWLVRAGSSLVIARFGAWSPVLEEQADLVASVFPGWSDDVHGCVELARRPPHGREPLDRLLDGFGAELEARYWETFGSS